MGSFWGFVTIIVIVSLIHDWKCRRDKLELTARQQRQLSADLEARLARMEHRLENLETIVLENEKHREFERQL